MSSIDQLMLGRLPGQIKIRRTTWPSSWYVRLFFKDGEGNWHGLDENNVHVKIVPVWCVWELFEKNTTETIDK